MSDEKPPPTRSPAHVPGDGLPAISPDNIEADFPETLENAIPSQGYQMRPMVGLGGSAGSIPALQKFFSLMPADTGMVFVVVLHLSPEFDSMLHTILGHSASMPVLQAFDGQKVAANTVYVIPPGSYLTSIDGELRLTEIEPERGKRVAVDLFFRSLADTHGPSATAIVLSGADGDGAVGIKRIKERGGLTIAQDPDEAEHRGMPKSAIFTGMVDWVLYVADMPERLIEYYRQEKRLRVPPEDGPQPASPTKTTADEDETALRDVLAYLHARTGRDFSCYKRATIVRRISRRLQINSVNDLPAYVSFLRTHPGEVGALLQDLLISVTNFFRDRDAFAAIEQLVPELFRNKGPSDCVRVWVPACATGEEAYSIAMLLLEHARSMNIAPAIQVFGSDLDETVVQAARAGVYPDTISADVNEERLRRFFIKESHGFRVRREVREVVLFAAHDLLKDAPFSRIDLISCRNLMIYLNRDAQKRAVDIFHFAMKPHGLLFLGSSETVDSANPLFVVQDKQHRIYRHLPGQRVGLPVPQASGTLARALQAQEQSRNSPVLPKRWLGSAAEGIPVTTEAVARLPQLSLGELHLRLLERFAPPSIVLNAEHEIVHLSHNAGSFLQLAAGELSRNLLRIIHPMLRVPLRAALFQVADTGESVKVAQVPLEVSGLLQAVNIVISPAGEIAPGFFLVVFEQSGDALPDGTALRRLEAEPVVRQLERESEMLRGRLRDTVEQYEANAEELKAGNEELRAMNEELHSASEELETSREELQSINEELTTVNSELKNKLEELSHSNSDLHNLMGATAIPTVFVDRDLRIMRFTPNATALFAIIPSDMGRPLTDLRHQLEYPQFAADLLAVLEKLTPIEREVRSNHHWYLARILPYRTLDDRIAGVVLAFVDITAAKDAEGRLRESEEQQALLLRLSDALRPLADPLEVQRTAVQILGEHLGVNRALYLEVRDDRDTISPGPSYTQGVRPMPSSVKLSDFGELHTGAYGRGETVVAVDVLADPNFGPQLSSAFAAIEVRATIGVPLVKEGRLVAIMGVHSALPRAWKPAEIALLEDVAERTWATVERARAEEALRGSEAQYRTLFTSMDEGFCTIEVLFDEQGRAVDYRFFETNPAFDRHTGIANARGKTMRELAPNLDEFWFETYGQIIKTSEPRRFEHAAAQLGKYYDVYAFPIGEPGRNRLAVFFKDISSRRSADEALRQSQELTRLIVENAREYAIVSMDLQRTITSWNPGAEAILGHVPEEVLGKSGDLIFTEEDRAAGAPSLEASKVLAQGRAEDERWHLRKDGSRFWGSGVMTAIQDVGGQAIGLVKIFRDHTTAREAQGALEQIGADLLTALQNAEAAQAEAENAGRAKDQFLAVLSHELRTPLTPVLMAVRALARSTDIAPKIREALEMIQRNVQTEVQLIDDLLDVTRIGRGKLQINRVLVDLHQILEAAVEISREDLDTKQQQLHVGLDAPRHVLSGDAKRLQQVFWNLLKNAAKFTGQKGRVALRTRNEADRIVVEIADSGVGFEPASAQRIFDPFIQGDETIVRKFGGLGLGLAISKAAIAGHGGTIRGESQGPGKGATFIVELPLHEA